MQQGGSNLKENYLAPKRQSSKSIKTNWPTLICSYAQLSVFCSIQVNRIKCFTHGRENSKLTLFPSTSKWVKFTVILHCGGARISQMQFLLAGYRSGKDGDVMVPLEASIKPPQASETTTFIHLRHHKNSYWKLFYVTAANIQYGYFTLHPLFK